MAILLFHRSRSRKTNAEWAKYYLQQRRREVVESDMNESDKRDSLYVLDIWLQEEAEEAANAEEYAKKAYEEKKDEQMRQEKQELDQHVEDI